ncbi:MAG: cytochrome c3 family protein [Candidatus Eisenbacteria bacterium]|nr:cytochrome c3 family protein [Candidatus Eisenbacteria bacterium]
MSRSRISPHRSAALRLAGLLIAVSFLVAGVAWGVTNEECLACHSDPSLTKTLPDGREVSLGVDEQQLANSVHAGFGCTDCHADATEIPHADDLAPVDCGMCHGDVQATFAGSIHGEAVAQGNPDAPRCADCHGSHGILPAGNDSSWVHPMRVVRTCARCHANPELVKKYDIRIEAPVEAYQRSVHGRALLIDNNPAAPTCSFCHPAHEMLRPTNPASTVARTNIPSLCGNCHGEIASVYLESIHGQAAMSGVSDSPVCIDCHGEHEILPPTDPRSTVFPANIARTTCTRCHASQILGQRYGFDATRIASYQQTYHGLATRKGALDVANCASCHGIHNIFASSDPRSTVNPANLQQTCGTCHPDATERFASINVHPTISGQGLPGPKTPRQIAREIYIILLIVVIGGMLAHNAIVWIYYVVEKRRREKRQAMVRRFTPFETVQHFLLLASFFILVFTGFALKFADSGWVRITEKLGMSEAVRGIVHRGAAVVMIASALAQVGFFLFTRRGRQEVVAILPKLRDVRDFKQNLAFHLHKTKERPLFARYDYTEKAEYLALIWGTAVMVFTGFVLWFPTFFTRYLPGWIFEVSEVVHYYEAWLAFLAILVWHFFYVIFHPEVQPLNLAFLDGKTPVEHAIHKHGTLAEAGAIEFPPAAAAEPRERAPEDRAGGAGDRAGGGRPAGGRDSSAEHDSSPPRDSGPRDSES